MPETPSSHPHSAPRWAWALATGFGSGRMPFAPGTWGSLAALLAWVLFTLLAVLPFVTRVLASPARPRLVLSLGALELGTPFAGLGLGPGRPGLMAAYLAYEALFLLLPALLTWASVRASELVARETGLKDPGFIVADEWAGLWIALWPLRWAFAAGLPGHPAASWILLALPFALFRLFDIWKPWPIRQIQVLPGGEGIVADDVVAGLYALVGTQLLLPLILQRLS